VTQLELGTPEDPIDELDLAAFFARLSECKDKNAGTHGLHPYPAKFIPHIPRALIRRFTRPGGLVWDPMCGSGTTLVEAALSGRPAIGTDLNPIAALIARAKTVHLSTADREALLRLVTALFARRPPTPTLAWPQFPNRSLWFSDEVAQELAHAKGMIDALDSEAARAVALCAFSAILVGVSNQESETRWCSRPNPAAPGSVCRRLAGKLAETVRALGAYGRHAPAPVEVRVADARHAGLPAGSVASVVTSPPYANAHDYYLYHKLRLFWLGHDVGAVQQAEIGSRNRHSDQRQDIGVYVAEMRAVYAEIRRVLEPGATCSVVVADAVIRGELFDVGELLGQVAVDEGLEPLEHHQFDHRQFNTAFQRGFGTRFRKATHVLVHRRPSRTVGGAPTRARCCRAAPAR
jgi:site-specific DNA-methyltransferase (cytosine-N4-specific)